MKNNQNLPYLVVTIDIQQAVERYTILTVFHPEGLYPIIHVALTFGLYCKHITCVQKFNLKVKVALYKCRF